ncbi:DNA-binding GntR family transcriptional regulator [Rhizobium leguminosarum]|uniref:DNA-binding GntR family transcriptional regulator n=1 Tax=Rhizobium leguminosarum TaxID=384 RepID=A0AAE2SXZ1_RHILE|nr:MULTISPECIES: GntR family transcriptional regulator [Rhizobium]MBB4292406.1 DNA-binding GntR family transcriptional regulator [Rhizobium leguminosarum]MBB4298644.1 DNA-binding GntR family transcriptional regulator [Rhizobium leguminosarum]MBB4310382.1 DNA-binding GntR family transcriptional regulator [Rhizobium leguminosarum]MBB4434644.1 DNA-binding GntR family transcriptional regulator [Rhizobium esperanzae]MBB4531540.1 DNA-binding GntR family transcriptional regulator [Rhizobium leguminos
MQDSHTSETTQKTIEETIVSGILSARIRPGTRLSENQLATLFGVSRTRVREAMMRLETRGIVHVSPRRGWFVVEPSAEEAIAVYEARRVIEAGLLRSMRVLTDQGRKALDAHLNEEKSAMAAGDRQRLTYLMGDFHIRIAELSGNAIIVDILRDLTARTILISMLYQSEFHAAQSHEGHCRIFQAMQAGDFGRAADLSVEHLDDVEMGLDLTARPDPLSELRSSLSLPPRTVSATVRPKNDKLQRSN